MGEGWPGDGRQARRKGLIVLTYVLRLLDPDLSHFAAASARVGLDYLIDLALLFGVWERWLAGEAPAGPAGWVKAERVAARRRGRLGGSRPGNRHRGTS